MQVKEGQQQFENYSKLEEFRYEEIDSSSLAPILPKEEAAFLTYDSKLRFLKDSRTKCVKKILCFDRDAMKVFELNHRKTAFKKPYTCYFEHPYQQIDWTEKVHHYRNKYTGELILSQRSTTNFDKKPNIKTSGDREEKEQILRFYRTRKNLKNAKKGDILKIEIIGELKNSTSFYNVDSIEPLMKISKPQMFIGASDYFLTEYSYKDL